MRRVLSLILFAVLAGAAAAQDLTDINEIVKRTNHTAYYQGQDGRARVQMTITDSSGNTREREFTILRRNADDKDQEE